MGLLVGQVLDIIDAVTLLHNKIEEIVHDYDGPSLLANIAVDGKTYPLLGYAIVKLRHAAEYLEQELV